jgi:hypothetical protein
MSSHSFRPLAMASALALCSVAFVGCTTTSPDGRTGVASSKSTVDAQTDATLARLYSDVPGAREIGAASKGILVFPAVVGGSFVVGAEYGRGALRSSDSARRYYSVAVGSVGWQVGAQSKAIVYMFTTTEALDKFRNSKGLDGRCGRHGGGGQHRCQRQCRHPPRCARRWWASCWPMRGWKSVRRCRA